MSNSYYDAADLKKFGSISDFQKQMGETFFNWYGEVFKESELYCQGKIADCIGCSTCGAMSLIVLMHTVAMLMKKDGAKANDGSCACSGAIRGGASLVHGVQMMNKVKEIAM